MRLRIAEAFAHAFLIRLTLVALLVGALLPAGWMPNPEGIGSGTPIVFCTGHGPVTIIEHAGHTDHGKPSKPADSPTQICVFAAAAAHATPIAAPVLALPYRAEMRPVAPRAPPAAIVTATYRPQSSRGPPTA